MSSHYQDDDVTVYHGDCIDVLATLAAESVDAVVTDPPYGLGFMGKDWDTSGALASRPPSADETDERFNQKYPRTGKGPAAVAFDGPVFQKWCQQWATECLRVLKPGGHLLAFGGTRTAHRLAVAVEDAGFEIRDSIAWIYGSGFPKSLDVSKAIDKAAGAEREVIGRHPSPAGNKPGGASLNMSLVGMPDSADITAPATDGARQWSGWGTALKPSHEPIIVARKPLIGTVAANVLAHGTGALNIDACRIYAEDVPAGRTRHGGGVVGAASSYELPDHKGEQPAGRWPANVTLDGAAADELDRQSGVLTSGAGNKANRQPTNATQVVPTKDTGQVWDGDSGGASRFFPTFRYEAKAPTAERPTANGTAHPTVKPIELMKWLCRLVTPPGGTILEPFAGSGTTVEAAVREGFRCIAIEREADYLPLITARLARPINHIMEFPA